MLAVGPSSWAGSLEWQKFRGRGARRVCLPPTAERRVGSRWRVAHRLRSNELLISVFFFLFSGRHGLPGQAAPGTAVQRYIYAGSQDME